MAAYRLSFLGTALDHVRRSNERITVFPTNNQNIVAFVACRTVKMAKKARVWTSSTSSVEAYVVHFNSYEELETELTRLRTSCSMGPCPILLQNSRTFLSKRSLPTRGEIDVDMFGIPEAGIWPPLMVYLNGLKSRSWCCSLRQL